MESDSRLLFDDEFDDSTNEIEDEGEFSLLTGFENDRVSKVGKSHIFGEEENEWDFSGKCDTSIGRLVGEHDTPN